MKLLTFWIFFLFENADAFGNGLKQRASLQRLQAKPQRYDDNVEGALYVNDRCINCATCSHFAPETFRRTSDHHVVSRQPTHDDDEMVFERARAALIACPVAAIRVEPVGSDKAIRDKLSVAGDADPFPLQLVKDVWFLGHNSEKSFGATPYLVYDGTTSVMVDTPRFSPAAVKAVKSLVNEPQYCVLTHTDDVAEHYKWHETFPNMKRIFHAADLEDNNWIGDYTLNDVEILLPKQGQTWNLNGEPISGDENFIIYHTPGHSPGSISMLYKPSKVLFTGDTYGYTTRTNSMTGFPRFGDDLHLQAETLKMIGTLDYDVIAPGHGHSMIYNDQQQKQKDLQIAIQELQTARVRR